MTKATTVTVASTAELTGTLKFKNIPLLESIAVKLSRTETSSKMLTDAIEETAAPQKVMVEPLSKMAVF